MATANGGRASPIVIDESDDEPSPPKKMKMANPYARKIPTSFPSENGKRKPATKILTPMERQSLNEALPASLNCMDRFFAALLLSSPSDFARSTKMGGDTLWKEICRRLSVKPPSAPLAALYRKADEHFDNRIALIMEEARTAVAEPLARSFTRESHMLLSVHTSERQRAPHNFTKITFQSRRAFTKEEAFNLRIASIVKLRPRDGSPNQPSGVCLGSITSANRVTVEKTRSFTVTVYTGLTKVTDDSDWYVTVLGTLITELRCVDALYCPRIRRLPLLKAIQGLDRPKPKKDPDFMSDDDSVEIIPKARVQKLSKYFQQKANTDMNSKQEEACEKFLRSDPNTVTLIQGPPGTGKTTLLTSLISKYLKEGGNKRLLVCAPTNKAIGVLASRFVEKNPEMNRLVMVGDAFKLLTEEKTSKQRLLSSIFVYTFTQSIQEDYRKIKQYFVPTGDCRSTLTPSDMHSMARRWQSRITENLSGLPKEYIDLLGKITSSLAALADGGAAHGIVTSLDAWIKYVKTDLPSDVVHRWLVDNARVIFCTLATAGGGLVRFMKDVDDVIVDEAAAATEPEIMIPLRLKPRRILCVGDPLQLPATLVSKRASSLGLAKSLQERLMFDCKYEHTMLNIQYRMHPDICRFPSEQFYRGRLQNGPNVGKEEHQKQRLLVNTQPYVFVNIKGIEEKAFGGSYRNNAEAKAVVDLVDTIYSRRGGTDNWDSANRIRIITFYQAQVGLIKRLLAKRGGMEKITVTTVDSSQGCEADTVIVSLVRSGQTNNPGFLTDHRRLNVALTRARYQLACVGSIDGLQSYVTEAASNLCQLAANAVERNAVVASPLAEQSSNTTPSQLDLFYGECDSAPTKKKLRRA